MRKEWKWLTVAAIAASLLTTALLILLFVPRLGWVGLHEVGEGSCPCCGGTGVFNFWGFLATLVIVLMMLSIPLSHIAVLVLAVTWIARADRSPRVVRHGRPAEDGGSGTDSGME
ncbi:MAG: hypothetical protein R6X31_05875 [Anaerolineae bacterium]